MVVDQIQSKITNDFGIVALRQWEHNLLKHFSFWVFLLICMIAAPTMMLLFDAVRYQKPPKWWFDIASKLRPKRCPLHLAINSCEACLASNPLSPSCSQFGHAFTRLIILSDSGIMTCLPLAENIGSTMLSATTPGVKRGP